MIAKYYHYAVISGCANAYAFYLGEGKPVLRENSHLTVDLRTPCSLPMSVFEKHAFKNVSF